MSGGGGGAGGVGVETTTTTTTRVSIPDNVKSTIQNIREITKKLHTDDEIFSVLKECSMDPNETAQKLMYLDTFHEVKKRRERRKENVKGRASEDFRTAPAAHRRVGRGGGQGNYTSGGAGGGRKFSARRENGASHVVDGGSLSSQPAKQKAKDSTAAPIAKASNGVLNGVKNLPNGTSSHVSAPNSSAGVSTAPRYASVVASSLVAGSKDQHKSPSPASVQLTSSATSPADNGVYESASDPLSTPIQESKDVFVEFPKSEHVAKEITESADAKDIGENMHTKSVAECPSSTDDISKANLLPHSNGESQPKSTDPVKVATLEVETVVVEASPQLPPELGLPVNKVVTFPNHIKVPESLRNMLTFGSINYTFGASIKPVSSSDVNGATGGAESSQDTEETAKESSLSDDSVASSVQGNLPENPLPAPNGYERLQPSEGIISSNPDSDSKSELLKQCLPLTPEVPHSLNVLNGPIYNLGFMPPMLGSQVLQVEGHDNQAHEATRTPNFVGNSVPSPNTTPPLPNSMTASPQIPVFRHAYPANYFPYGYMPPYLLSPMHQFLSPNGFPPQPSAYLPPTAPTAAGIKYPPPQFKAGSNAGNPAQYNIQSGGSFVTTPAGYASGSAVTSERSIANTEDLIASQLKENHIYTTGQMAKGQTVWYHTPGPDISSLYNLPQGQRFVYSPVQLPGHGTMNGVYPPGQTMASPTYLQQTQAVAGVTESVGPPPAAYQQPPHAQMNWNSNFN